jgi:ERCC4-related helicase
MQNLQSPIMLNDFTPRLYQEKIIGTATLQNTLVVLPTGLGKTAIAMMLGAHRLSLYPSSKIVILAPTRPLVEQHKRSFAKHFGIPEEKLVVFTGTVAPKKRAELWLTGKVFFSTPQGFENDVMGNRINLRDVSMLCLDEAHHAVGEYAYVFVAQKYAQMARYPRILALTASPGSKLEKVQEVCANLSIESIEVRTEEDADVKPYVKKKETRTINLEFPESFKVIRKELQSCLDRKLQGIKDLGLISDTKITSKRQLLGLQMDLVKQMTSGARDFETLKSVSLAAEAMKVNHGIELIETQGINSLKAYIDRIYAQASMSKTKAVKNLIMDPHFKAARALTDTAIEKGMKHPKLDALKEILTKEFTKNQCAKCIVFTQYRDTALAVQKEITDTPAISELFFGQSKKRGTGLTQKQQIELLDQFRDGLFNTLISTSVGEEGLDIPSVDLVVFYEPIPSAIRSIQRSGRTARQEEGKVIILCTKNTRDEMYKWSAHHKQKRMYRFLKDLKKSLILSTRTQKPLTEFTKNKTQKNQIKVFADYREKGSAALKELLEIGVELGLESLPCADYVLSSRVGVEIKKVRDFVDSILDGRLLSQLKELRINFERPVVLIEGDEDLYKVRNVHPKAIQGMLATIAISYGIPIIQTKTPRETAQILYSMAKREQEDGKKNFSYHFSKRAMTDEETQEYVVAALPAIGPKAAQDLLNHFGSILDVMRASGEQLQEVPGIGKKTAQRVKKIIEKKYKKQT